MGNIKCIIHTFSIPTSLLLRENRFSANGTLGKSVIYLCLGREGRVLPGDYGKFLTWKFIFQCSELHTSKYFPQVWWEIYIRENATNMDTKPRAFDRNREGVIPCG